MAPNVVDTAALATAADNLKHKGIAMGILGGAKLDKMKVQTAIVSALNRLLPGGFLGFPFGK